MTQVIVTIADTVCDIQTITASQITCDTNSYAYSSIKAPVQVFILNKGYALNNGSVQYQYIDLWSSQWTWGGLPPPGEGELAVISFGQTIYFDAVSTPKLKGIIIQGGSLIFDDNQDVSLNVEYIIIADKGTLQIGTKAQPFQHKAIITMFGSIRSVELPIFGSKVIAVRNGTIDLHGAPVGVTWTYLNTTAAAGTSTIKLNEPVIWPINSQIVIATTGNKFSNGQTETRMIVSKLADNQTLTLDRPLQFEHLAEMRTVGTGSRQLNIFVRAEVGLLTRNVVFKGNNDDSWAPFLTAPACPSGFDPSPFAVQTCFLGRYGPELGTDQFGGTIMLSGDMRQSGQPESVIGRFSNVELFHVGQAYRLGRYPIHFHMNGDMQSSYVSECTIHQSFNRATNIHASNYLTIDRNVIYDIMGGAYFLEDGVEIGNVYQYNLAIFVKPSSSSINEDMTPAAFWATNPNNFYLHNAVAGTSHFGFWFRMLDNPDGPSYNRNYHPYVMPLGRFFNNSVHSSGEFGLWVFPKFLPQNSQWDSTIKPAVFESFTSYSCDKGAEFDQSNNLQFKNFIVWDQYSVGIETQTIIQNQDINSQKKYTFYNNVTGAGVFDSIIIGNSLSNTQSLTPSGLVVAWDRGELISNVSFYNFPTSYSAAIRPTSIIGRCV